MRSKALKIRKRPSVGFGYSDATTGTGDGKNGYCGGAGGMTNGEASNICGQKGQKGVEVDK